MSKLKHILFETEDKDAPDSIRDRNGEVCLDLCKVCHGAEACLPTNCPGRPLTYFEMDKIQVGELDF